MPVARRIGFALLATLGAAEWARMVGEGGFARALPWVLIWDHGSPWRVTGC